jgi:hypothetical protein
MGTELQVRLSGLAAPEELVDWARRFPDLESCWNACTTPELLLWLAARLSTTAAQRRAVIAVLAELTRQAERGSRHPSQAIERAAGTAEAWARTGAGPAEPDTAEPDTAELAAAELAAAELAAAERAALEAAQWASSLAAEEGARARVLLRSSPRPRGGSFGRSRGLTALEQWEEANRARRLALAAAGTAHAAAEAARAQAGWEAGVSASAGYAVSALDHHHGAGTDSRTARRAAALIRRRLPCPRLAGPLS